MFFFLFIRFPSSISPLPPKKRFLGEAWSSSSQQLCWEKNSAPPSVTRAVIEGTIFLGLEKKRRKTGLLNPKLSDFFSFLCNI